MAEQVLTFQVYEWSTASIVRTLPASEEGQLVFSGGEIFNYNNITTEGSETIFNHSTSSQELQTHSGDVQSSIVEYTFERKSVHNLDLSGANPASGDVFTIGLEQRLM